MESALGGVEYALRSQQGQSAPRRIWPFLASSSERYECPKCRAPVLLLALPSGMPYFAHASGPTACTRYRGQPDLKHEAKHLLIYALEQALQHTRSGAAAATNAANGAVVLVQRACEQCGDSAAAEVRFDSLLDPLGAGVELPDNYVDDGAELLLYYRGRRAASLAFAGRDRPDSGRSSAPAEGKLTRILTNPAVACLDVLNFLSEGSPSALRLTDARKVAECGQKACLPLRELARLTGWRRSWTSDDVDWDSDCPDLSQYVANACTGKIRLFFEWLVRPSPLVTGTDLRRLMAEIQRRNRCLFCEQPKRSTSTVQGDVKDCKAQGGLQLPFCEPCWEKIRTKEYKAMPRAAYDTVEMDPEVRRDRQRQIGWVRSFPYVKKPDKPDNPADLPSPEKPCCGCGAEQYHVVFYYGYHAICAKCLYQEYRNRLGDTEHMQ